MSEVTELISLGDHLFGKRENLLSFWDEVFYNFDPSNATFQSTRSLGDDYASDLTTSQPLLVARDLIDSLSSMRPAGQSWFEMEVEDLNDHDGKRWLEWATKLQRRAMYDRAAQFVIAAKDTDNNYALAGQGVVTIETMPDRSSLLYRSWHLRDVAWSDGLDGATECVHQKMKMTAHQMRRTFGDAKLHPKVRECLEKGKNPYHEFNLRRVVIPTDMYHGESKFRTKLVDIYIDVDNEHRMEVTGQRINPFVIPRWKRIRGSQYAISPAVLAGLPEARLLQAMTYTLLQAGEKAADPPILATHEAVRSELNLMAGGVTWIREDYDERTGAALRSLEMDRSGMPLGLELQQRSESILNQAFYLDKFRPPVREKDMTAFEFSKLWDDYMRNLGQLVEPYETDFNGGMCERTFEVLLMNGAFGSPDTIPESLRGEDVRFKFKSPTRDAEDKAKGQIFVEGIALVKEGMALDPSVGTIPNAVDALRGALQGIGWKEEWLNSREAAAAMAQNQAAQVQQERMLAMAQQGAATVADLSKARAA